MNGLHFSHRTESGVLFHMIGAVSEFGKLGVTVIGNDVEEVEGLYGAGDRACSTPSARWARRPPASRGAAENPVRT